MGREEQVEEREVLDSIFPDEITDISDTAYRVAIVLDVIGSNAGDDSEAFSPTLLLKVSYPPDYPDVAPALSLSAPPNTSPYQFLDVSKDRDHILSSLTPIIDENLGMAMVFTLVSSVKDAAEQLIAERVAERQRVKDQEARRAEEEENRKFTGEVVTRERFMAWREQFRQEMLEKEKEEEEREREGEGKKAREGRAREEARLSGRELWERGLAGKGDEDEADEDEEEAIKGMEELKVGN